MAKPDSPGSFTGPSGPPAPVRDFNAQAAGATEIEIKLLVSNKNLSVFGSIENYFQSRGWARCGHIGNHLLTRQLDTAERDFYKRGETVRIRGTCRGADLNDIVDADICIKSNKSFDESGAVRRSEYESRIPGFDIPTFETLAKKYPARDYPALHRLLADLEKSDMIEHFRIDCMRRRMVIEMPERIHKIKGKKFFGEICMDDVLFVLDVPGMDKPMVFKHDLEIECEALFKPCDYDKNPEARHYVSSPLTSDELDTALKNMKTHLRRAARTSLVDNTESKAERGFNALEKVAAKMQNFGLLERNLIDSPALDGKLQTVFRAGAPNESASSLPPETLASMLSGKKPERRIARRLVPG